MAYHHPIRQGWDEAIKMMLDSSRGSEAKQLHSLISQLGKKLVTSVNSPEIGMFDSGIGGLSVYKELKEQFPHIRVAFLGDMEEPGYSKIPSLRVAELSRDTVSWLQKARGVGMTLVTCNLASYAMSKHGILQEPAFKDHPVIPITPPYADFFAVRSRIDPQRRAVGIFASDSVCLSGFIQDSIRTAEGFTIVNNAVEFKEQARTTDCIGCSECHLAVDHMYPWENGPEAPEVELMLRKKFRSYLSIDGTPLIDYLVFGCTHFPVLAKAVSRIFGGAVMFVDPAVYQVKLAGRWIQSLQRSSSNLPEFNNSDEFYVGLEQGRKEKFDVIESVVKSVIDIGNSSALLPIKVIRAACADRMGRSGICLASNGTSISQNPCLGQTVALSAQDERQLLSLSLKRTGRGLCNRSG
jgi:glutamate racemase